MLLRPLLVVNLLVVLVQRRLILAAVGGVVVEELVTLRVEVHGPPLGHWRHQRPLRHVQQVGVRDRVHPQVPDEDEGEEGEGSGDQGLSGDVLETVDLTQDNQYQAGPNPVSIKGAANTPTLVC